MRRLLVLGTLFFIVFLAMGIFGWYYYRTHSEDSGSKSNVEPFVIPEWYHTDKDGDGISDSVESEQGTSIYESDTDGDGVSDILEIEVYGTDPTNPDTDGDGYTDGLEIIGGHNPLEKALIEQ
jgi:hypothetical protein